MPRPLVPIVAGLAALVGTEVPRALVRPARGPTPIRRDHEEVPR
jgi:hypothetical protein